MTTLREAAQQALEALEGKRFTACGWRADCDKAITALRAALAEHDKKIVWVEERKAHWAEQLQLARETQERERQQREESALAEPVQEPVANDDEVICPACCHQFRAIPPNVQQLMLNAGFKPPFTAPPQRKPMTEEEIDNIWDSEKAFADIYAIARAIERAVWEKNNG